MRCFGQLQKLVFSDGSRPVLTPVGLQCFHCREDIAANDAGVYLENSVAHEECFVRRTWGSVGHLRHRCPCFGGELGDPPGLSVRDAARAALAVHLKGWEFPK